jgi:beta-N-acetylhexosaminidase
MQASGAGGNPAFGGQLLMVGLPGPRLDQVARELIRDLRVGGVILFARNLTDGPEAASAFIRELQQEAAAAGSPPLLVAIDQEGGPVQRLKEPLTRIPAARELGAQATPGDVEALARQVGRELALVGVNMNLAPVLDAARGPECPLYDRSFGGDPQHVAAYGCAAIRGYLAGGVLPTAKHFPGLGDTTVDSHQVLPRAVSPDPLRELDLHPFRQAAAAGVPAVMTAHLTVPAWEERPATLSPVALTGWLRGRLNFGGVIITDDLEMGAIAEKTSVAPAAAEALAAGADLLLICTDVAGAWEAARLIAGEAALVPRVAESATRLLRLRERLSSPPPLAQLRDYLARRRPEEGEGK